MRAQSTTPSITSSSTPSLLRPSQDRAFLPGRAGRPGWDRRAPKPRSLPRPRPSRKPGSVR